MVASRPRALPWAIELHPFGVSDVRGKYLDDMTEGRALHHVQLCMLVRCRVNGVTSPESQTLNGDLTGSHSMSVVASITSLGMGSGIYP
jgi:hypothetical protein